MKQQKQREQRKLNAEEHWPEIKVEKDCQGKKKRKKINEVEEIGSRSKTQPL